MKHSKITISKILSFVETKYYQLKNKPTSRILKFNSLNSAKDGDITFCSIKGKNGKDLVVNSLATLVICHSSLKSQIKNGNSNYIFQSPPSTLNTSPVM